MADEPKEKKSWLHHVPVTLGATAAVMTATSSLLVALQQVNILKPTPASTASPTVQANPTPSQVINSSIDGGSKSRPSEQDEKGKGKDKGKDRGKGKE